MKILGIIAIIIIVAILFWLISARVTYEDYFKFKQILKHIDEVEYQYYHNAKYSLGIRREGETIVQIEIDNDNITAFDKTAGNRCILCPFSYFITVRKLRKELMNLIPPEFKEGKRLKIKTFEDYL